LRLDEIAVEDRCRQQLGDVSSLARSISSVGLLHFPIVTTDYRLVAGERRIEAVRSLEWESIPCHVVANLAEAAQLLAAERDENLERLPLTPEEATRLADRFMELERPAAQERQRAGTSADGQAGGRGRRGNLRETFPEVSGSDEPGRSHARAARAAGMSRPTYEKAKAVREAAAQDPERFGPLLKEMNRGGKVNGVYKKLRRMQQQEQIEAEPPPLPTGPFRVIVIDPPWKYDNRPDDSSHRASNPYPSMSLQEITDLDVPGLVGSDCILWLWTTNSHLPHAFSILDGWGFSYKTMLTWVKDRMGTGEWLRGRSEHCLLAVRGRPTINLTNQTTVIEGPLREHSRKPESFYQLVESLCPGSKVELFAREARPGWVQHGDQADLFSRSASG
jgi:N6-adenosine-specific RNA methylase IME4/ParB-like chromosome segregation protein Spo0J